MTPEELNIACAEAFGYTKTGNYYLPPPNSHFNHKRNDNGLPDFISDANAQRDAFLELSEEKRKLFHSLILQMIEDDVELLYPDNPIEMFFFHFAEIYLKPSHQTNGRSDT